MKLLFEYFPFQFIGWVELAVSILCYSQHYTMLLLHRSWILFDFQKLNIIKYQYNFNGFENAKIARNWNIRFEFVRRKHHNNM